MSATLEIDIDAVREHMDFPAREIKLLGKIQEYIRRDQQLEELMPMVNLSLYTGCLAELKKLEGTIRKRHRNMEDICDEIAEAQARSSVALDEALELMKRQESGSGRTAPADQTVRTEAENRPPADPFGNI